MRKLIPREAYASLKSSLEDFNCALLLGPRQVGKTTLARQLEKDAGTGALYLDLEQEQERHLISDFTTFAKKQAGKLIILDETQCVPALFPKLRRQLDEQERDDRRDTRWLLLGSATTELQSLAGSQLGGRYGSVDLAPFQLGELDQKISATTDTLSIDAIAETLDYQSFMDSTHPSSSLNQLWLRGGFPRSYLVEDNKKSLTWRREYLKSIFISQTIANKSLAKPTLLAPLWERLSINQGCPCNFEELSSQLGCKLHELKELLHFLVTSQLLRELRPWSNNENKRLNQRARFFIRDSGLLHVHWGISTQSTLKKHEINGKSWEGFVLENLLSAVPPHTKAYFYRNHSKDEIDLVLEFNTRQKWAVEIKINEKQRPRRGFYRACEELEADHRFLVHSGPASLHLKADTHSQVEALCLKDAVMQIRSSPK